MILAALQQETQGHCGGYLLREHSTIILIVGVTSSRYAGGMELYVVYFNPLDFPGKYVIRKQIAGRETVLAAPEPLIVGSSLDEVRAALPDGLTRLDRSPSDVASIVEVWL